MAKTPAWQRAAGKNPEGGLNEKGRASLRAAGHDIKRPQPEGGARKDSFCRRMKGMKAKLTSSETANDPNSRINKSLRKWKCADGGFIPHKAKDEAHINFQYSKPESNKTELGIEEPYFRRWVSANQIPFDPNEVKPDYDMRGYYKAAMSGNPIAATSINPNDQQRHFPDRWKTPMHESFSAQSQYSTPNAPDWNEKDQLVNKSGLIVFDERMGRNDGGPVDPYDSVQQAAKGGPIWDKPRPKKLGKSEPLSPKEKSSAKAMAKAAGRPYPNLIDNMRAAKADGGSTYPLADREDWTAAKHYEDRGGRMEHMSPEHFLNRTRHLDIDDKTQRSIDAYKGQIASGHRMNPLQLLANGLEDGRHRATAAKELGIRSVPVVDFRADGGEVDPYADVQRAAREDGGSAYRLSPWERAKLAASEYLGPKQEWQTLRDQVMKSGAITPNPQGQPLTESVNKAITMAGYPAIGQPFTYHRLNRLPMGEGTWRQTDANKMEYTPSSWKPMPNEFPISPEDARKIDNYTRYNLEGATPYRFASDPMNMPTTPRQPMNVVDQGAIPAASTRFMETPIKVMAGMQSPRINQAIATQYGQTGFTGKPISPSGDSGVVASDRIIPAAHTPAEAQIPWDQTRAVLMHDQYPGRFPQIPQSELTSQGSTSMLGHVWGTGSINPNAIDPNAVRGQQQSEINDILETLRKTAPSSDNLGPVSPAPTEGGVGENTDEDIQSPMARGGQIWDRPRPKKLGKSKPLSPKDKSSAKAMAAAAGRPYPNLIDNMRAARADGGEVEGDVQFAPDDPYAKVQQAATLPMMAQHEYAMRMPEPEVRYDTGPQPGEATLKGYDPTIKERIYQGIAGTEERPSPERAQFARGMSQMAEFAPVLGNVMAGQEAQRRGDTKGMLMAALPVPGMATEARMAEAAASPVQQAAREAYQRVLNAQGMYSHAAEAAYNLPQAKGSYEQMMAMLQKAGVKPEELRWSGVEQFAGQPVTREQLVRHFEQGVPKIEETVLGGHTTPYPHRTADEWENAIDRAERAGDWDESNRLNAAWEQLQLGTGVGRPKFEQYTIPGGENYREVLLGLPERIDVAGSRKVEDFVRSMQEKHGERWLSKISPAEEKQYDDLIKLQGEAEKRLEYRSGHWDQPNVLGHLRLSDRTGPQGEKILHMEELQSDWGQAGRKQGFAQKVTPEMQEKVNEIASKLDPKFVPAHARTSNGTGIDTENFLLRDINHWKESGAITPEDAVVLTNYANIKSGVGLIPSAPYVEKTQNWVDLGLKRALKEAAEKGYDKLVWTPGSEQAARYKLSKHIDGLSWSPDTNQLIGFKDGVAEFVKDVPKEDLHKFIGESAAEKLMQTEPYMLNNRAFHHLEGQEMDVGGEGMKSFYDSIIPSRLKELMKKIDPQAKVELGGHPITAERGKPTQYADFDEWNNAPKSSQINAHSIQITPKMREAILKGLPAYAKGGEVVNDTDPYDNIRLKAKNFPRARRASN